MLQRSKALMLFFMMLTRGSWAFDGLSLEPGSGSQLDQLLSLAAENSLIEQGCKVKIKGSSEISPSAASTLLLRLTPVISDQAHGRYMGYGVQLDSILWTASVRVQLIETDTQKILASFEESAQERQIPSSNGSQDLSALTTDSQVVDGLTRKIGRQLALKTAGTLNGKGGCSSVASHLQPQYTPPPLVEKPITEAKKPEMVFSEDVSSASVSQNSKLASNQMHSEKTAGTSPGKTDHDEYRVALVIGNAHYKHIPILSNPSNDARYVSEQILAAGFELVGGAPFMDLTKPQLERAIADFGRLLSQHSGAVGFFYYAGHGMQVNGSNYLVPVDANPNRIADLSRQAIEVDSLLQEMEDSRTGLNIIVLDACRNNPFGGRGIRESGAGLAQMRAPKGSIIVYATQPGNIAQDGPAGQNSPFAKALAYALAETKLDLFGTFNEVGLLVSNATGGEQQPWISSSPIAGRFCFKECPP